MIGSHTRMRTVILSTTAVLFAVAVLFMTSGASSLFRPDGPGKIMAKEVVQEARAEDSGISIELRGAIFSGTETRIHASVIFGSSLSDSRRTPERISIDNAAVILTGFGQGTASSHENESGDLVLQLPPLDSSAQSSGARIDISSLTLHWPDQETTDIPGEWSLTLTVPKDLSSTLRVEASATQTVLISGIAFDVRFIRSTTETILEYAIPPYVEDLSQPRISSRGDTLLPLFTEVSGVKRLAHFRETPFGAEVTVDLGQLSVSSEGPPTVLVVRSAGTFRRLGVPIREGAEAQYSGADVESGDPNLLISSTVGFSASDTYIGGKGPTIQFLVRGAWNRGATPVVLATDGSKLRVTSWTLLHNVDPAGKISTGTSMVKARFEDESQLERVTLQFHREAAVIDGPAPFKLVPQK